MFKTLCLALPLAILLGCSDAGPRGDARVGPWPSKGTSSLDYDPYGSTRQPAEGDMMRGDHYESHGQIDIGPD